MVGMWSVCGQYAVGMRSVCGRYVVGKPGRLVHYYPYCKQEMVSFRMAKLSSGAVSFCKCSEWWKSCCCTWLLHLTELFVLFQVLKVAILAEKFATDYSWYVDTILTLIRIAGDYVSEEVGSFGHLYARQDQPGFFLH